MYRKEPITVWINCRKSTPRRWINPFQNKTRRIKNFTSSIPRETFCNAPRSRHRNRNRNKIFRSNLPRGASGATTDDNRFKTKAPAFCEGFFVLIICHFEIQQHRSSLNVLSGGQNAICVFGLTAHAPFFRTYPLSHFVQTPESSHSAQFDGQAGLTTH